VKRRSTIPYPSRGDETFELLMLGFNVTRALEIIAKRKEKSTVAIDLKQSSHRMCYIKKDFALSDRCDPTRAGIIAVVPFVGAILIDGNHRAWRADHDGIEFRAHVLDEKEARACCYTRDLWRQLRRKARAANTSSSTSTETN
jgi:hypothetical protein